MITGIAMMPETVEDARLLREIMLSASGRPTSVSVRGAELRSVLAEQVVSDDVLIAWDIAHRCGLDDAFYVTSVAKQIMLWVDTSDIQPLDAMFPFPPEEAALDIIVKAIDELDAGISTVGIPVSSQGWVGIDDFRGSEAMLVASLDNPLVRLLERVCGRSPLSSEHSSSRIAPVAARPSQSNPAFLELNLDTMMGWCAAILVARQADLSMASTSEIETAAA